MLSYWWWWQVGNEDQKGNTIKCNCHMLFLQVLDCITVCILHSSFVSSLVLYTLFKLWFTDVRRKTWNDADWGGRRWRGHRNGWFLGAQVRVLPGKVGGPVLWSGTEIFVWASHWAELIWGLSTWCILDRCVHNSRILATSSQLLQTSEERYTPI